MDITLNRILSLLPKKEDGSFVRGAKKDFAVSIGYDSGDIISMWEKESSSSYKIKLHEIAAKYNVSVEWLRGETDEKKPTPVSESGLEPERIELMEWIKTADFARVKGLYAFTENDRRDKNDD